MIEPKHLIAAQVLLFAQLDNKIIHFVARVFGNLKKAFDTVDHGISTQKLENYDV